MARILVIDDEPGICRAFERYLKTEGHEVRTSSRAETGLTLAEAFEPDLVFLDVRLPGMSGLEALERLQQADPGLPVVVVTAYGTMETAVTAMRQGAYDYLLKPLDLDRIAEVIGAALASRKASSEIAVGGRPERTAGERGPLIGRAPAIQEVFKRIGAVSLTDVPVLIVGEAGTGKEMVARAIHYSGSRARGPFEPVSCAAIPEERLLGELFGAPARVERAAGGTLFLDDVAALPATLQVALLRLLQEGAFEREGPGERVEADVRVVAAAAADVRGAVEGGTFREDLYYRLNVMSIRVPPLRERLGDLPELAAHFLAGRGAALSKSALRLMLQHAWPGNVRELRNALEHALVLSRGGTILPEHLPDTVAEGAGRRPAEEGAIIRAIIERALESAEGAEDVHARLMERFEAPLIEAVLERTGGNQVQAARMLGIHRTTLRGKIRRYGL